MLKEIKNKPKGFTLMEVMVATVLMALMGILLMTSLNTSVNAKENVEHISQRFQDVRQAMSRMSREISMAYLSKHVFLADPIVVTQFKGYKDRLYFSAFGHSVHQKDAKESDEQVIGFYLAPDKNGQMSLMRRMQANLNLDVETGGRAQVLCPNVTKLSFSYFDDKLNKWDEQWIADPTNNQASAPLPKPTSTPGEEKDTEAKPTSSQKSWRLPSFVKISMTAEMGNGEEMTWVSETQIVVQDPLDL